MQLILHYVTPVMQHTSNRLCIYDIIYKMKMTIFPLDYSVRVHSPYPHATFGRISARIDTRIGSRTVAITGAMIG